MKKTKELFCIASLALGLGGLTLLGCSVIGLTIGSIADAKNKKDWRDIPGWEVATVEPGTSMSLVLKDGSMVRGIYTGLEPIPYEQYEKLYNQARSLKSPNMILPSLGDSVVLAPLPIKEAHGVRKHSGLFKGFDFGAVLISKKMNAIDFRMDINQIDTMTDSRQLSMSGKELQEWAASGRLPYISGIKVLDGKEKKVFSMNQIEQVNVPTKKHGAATGFIVGAVIDVALVVTAVVIASSIPDFSGGSSGGGSSESMCCPFVYSHDGRNYVLDSETFGGAIFHAAQRTDLDNLDHLRESSGVYRLKLTNELQETQFVDELKLVAVDHPSGTRVVPSFDGKLVTFSSPRGPKRAVDFEGSDVSGLVRQKDERLWVSNPFGRDAGNREQVRDGLILEFDRPAESASVKLVFNVQNTMWASAMQGRMLSLQGRELPNWYALLDSSLSMRKALFKAMVREGMLLIKLWNGQTWRDAGFVWEVGPNLPKDQAVRLDIHDIPGPNLKVKLESTAGFWMINSVEADYSPDASIKTTEFAPFQAFDQLHRDVSGLLSACDENYYEMPTTQDWAEIVFKALPRPEADRSFLLKSSGYYTIHVAVDGEPQRELVKKLIATPGAYGQYALDQLNRCVSAAWSSME